MKRGAAGRILGEVSATGFASDAGVPDDQAAAIAGTTVGT